ncbi:MAG: hypothetical protein H7Y31_12535 [Chitinophagaceae bacterium]|nr:hypothetical protein [Chitinophagaceae bacterium]
MKKKYIWLTVLLLLIVAAFGMYREYNRQRKETISQAPKFQTTALAILDEFRLNQQAADQKYSGLDVIVAVTGTIKETIEDDGGQLILVLGDSTSLSAVRCTVDSTFGLNKESVTRGMEVKVKGNFTGYKADELGIGADIEMNFCVLDSPEIKRKQL